MNDQLNQQIRSVETWPRRAGRKELLRHLRCKRLTRDEAIQARCYYCVCGEEGSPCNVGMCPLTQYCPRNRKGGINKTEN